MKKFLDKIKKWFLRNWLMITALLSSYFIIKTVLKTIAEKIDNVESPVYFIKDKDNEGVIFIKKDKEFIEVKLPDDVSNKDVLAVQLNKETQKVEVEIKHEKITFNNNNNTAGSSNLDLGD